MFFTRVGHAQKVANILNPLQKKSWVREICTLSYIFVTRGISNSLFVR
jgi:hypothetical protein